MTNLDFLNGFQLEAAPEPQKGGSSGPRLQKRPNEEADLRIFKNGRVYPSEQFAATFELEFQPKEENIEPISGNVEVKVLGNGLDFIDSAKWVMTEKLAQRVLFIGITPRQGNGKIDAMGSCSYEDDGTPKKSIMDSGSYTVVKEQVIPALAEVFGINWEETAHVDLKVVTDYPMVSPNGFYIIPKVVARGEDKGKPSFARRENINIFPLSLVSAEVKKEVEAKDLEVADLSAQVPNQEAVDAQEVAETPAVPSDANPSEATHSAESTMGNPLDRVPENTTEEPIAKRNVLDELGLN